MFAMFKFAAFIASLYILFCLLYYFRQDAILFYQRPIEMNNRADFANFEISFDHDGIRLHGWFVNRGISRQKPLIVYYGGNAEEVSIHLLEMDLYPGNSLLLINYRGYGESQGKPSQTNLYEDALFIIDEIIQQAEIDYDQVVIMGRSLGSTVATYVARQRPVQAVILVEPFDSALSLGQFHLPYLPVRWLLKHPFDALQHANHVKQPLLALIAEQDEIVPSSHSLKLVNQWQGKTTTIMIEEATHNTIAAYPKYWLAIRWFLSNR